MPATLCVLMVLFALLVVCCWAEAKHTVRLSGVCPGPGSRLLAAMQPYEPDGPQFKPQVEMGFGPKVSAPTECRRKGGPVFDLDISALNELVAKYGRHRCGAQLPQAIVCEQVQRLAQGRPLMSGVHVAAVLETRAAGKLLCQTLAVQVADSDGQQHVFRAPLTPSCLQAIGCWLGELRRARVLESATAVRIVETVGCAVCDYVGPGG